MVVSGRWVAEGHCTALSLSLLLSPSFCLLPSKQHRGMESEGCDQYIAFHLCCSSVVTLCLCSTLAPPVPLLELQLQPRINFCMCSPWAADSSRLHPLLQHWLLHGCTWTSALYGAYGLQGDSLLHHGRLLGCRELLLRAWSVE